MSLKTYSRTNKKVDTSNNFMNKPIANKKKKSRFFETYISKVLKQISDKNGITSNSKQQLNSSIVFHRRLIYYAQKKSASGFLFFNTWILLDFHRQINIFRMFIYQNTRGCIKFKTN